MKYRKDIEEDIANNRFPKALSHILPNLDDLDNITDVIYNDQEENEESDNDYSLADKSSDAD